jgi:cyclopropane fatty-acyl-phospholipid synthase-like methyltransferase
MVIFGMDNKTLEESVLTALDGTNIGILKHFPYIFQDSWELGTSAEEIIPIIKKYTTNHSNLSILDLGSGKGAFSIKIASELKCKCFGIEGIEEFVKFSNNKSKEYSVDDLCTFETNDIRTRIKTLGKYDIILSMAIGPILGNYYETLTQLSSNLNNDGLIIIDDAYIEDSCNKVYPKVLQENVILKQINDAGMEIIEKITISELPETEEMYDVDFENLEKRCKELIEKYPEEKEIFLEYIENQKREYEILSKEIIPVIFVIKKKL